jgi:hypothetical protein
MDRSKNGAYTRTQDAAGVQALEPLGRASVDSQGSRLQKKRSVCNVSQPLPTANRGMASQKGDAGPGGKARKGSLRDAVRKIFGRGSKELEEPMQKSSPPRHGYHRSEPPTLPTQPEHPESERQDFAPHRTLSAPLQVVSPPPTLGHQRARSPYAVEFPQSARLKPMQLANPFVAPGSQLRRRKTLPSVIIAEDEAAALSSSMRSSEAPPVPSLEISRETPTPEIGLATSYIANPKRRSRSADDMKNAMDEQVVQRKRSEEIRYWRESFQPSVLRASGFMTRVPREEDFGIVVEEKTPTLRVADPFETAFGGSGGSSARRHGPSLSAADACIGSISGMGTELSRDLEDRVAKLEAGLHSFQQSLHRLTAERNRRTVLVGGGIPQRRNSIDGRTASMLADTLSDFAPSPSQVRYERPTTSPPPHTPTRSIDTARPNVPRLPTETRANQNAPRRPSPPVMAPLLPAGVISGIEGRPSGGNGSGNGNGNGKTQDYTFRSLYEMLADERSARRKLETQLKGLRAEINELQYQVSVQGSHVQSQRSSFQPPDPMVGSSRLHRLLQETEASRPGTAESPSEQQQRHSGGTGVSSIPPPRIVSRFSRSESELGGVATTATEAEAEAEELETPYEAYQTPHEEEQHSGRFHFQHQQQQQQRDEPSGMF